MLCALALLALPVGLAAQTTTSGDIAGTLTDPQGAVVPNATITLTNDATGQQRTVTTNNSGYYRASSLAPGSYTIDSTVPGFAPMKKRAVVSIGQATTTNLALTTAQVGTTVEVSAEAPVIQTENGNTSTAFDTRQIELMPNGGGDTSYIAQTAPGVNINTSSGGGYGNFSAFGLPATSNLFTTNGNDNMDPYLNLNNSGATNLSLGANELAEVSVVNNGYDVNFGRQAGSQVNSSTKSGTNAFHGNAIYQWNGRAMNADNWFNKHADVANGGVVVPTGFVNANQYAASLGGPIRKDKTFFFVDTEGLRVIIPVSAQVFVPTAAYENYVLGTGLPGAGQSAQVPYYQNLFNIYNKAAGAHSPHNASTEEAPSGTCGDFGGTGGFSNTDNATAPCAQTYRTSLGNFAHEWLLAARIDHQLTNVDKMYVRYHMDKGTQPTYTDPLDPAFNTLSPQPSYDGQLSETHTFGSKAVNQFILSGAYYRAIFINPQLQQSLAIYPTTTFFGDGGGDGVLTTLGGENYVFPQGRNVTQYQIVDDFNYNLGNHTVKLGVNFRRNDVTDYAPSVLTSGEQIVLSMTDFSTGVSDFFSQRFPEKSSVPVAIWSAGFYGQDDWRITPNLKLNLGLRLDHDSNPVCQINCFNRLGGPFNSLGLTGMEAYNSIIHTGLHQALPSTQAILWQPRIGFAWTPRGSDKGLVVRGGGGIFYDLLPGVLADNYIRNAPGVASFTDQFNGSAFAPGVAGSTFTVLSASNAEFRQQFANGGTLDTIKAALAPIPFNGLSYQTTTNKVKTPQFQEYNLAIEQAIGSKNSVSLNYVGNHGINIPVYNGFPNAACRSAANCTILGTTRNAAFGNVRELNSTGYSHYNGIVASVQRKFSAGFQAQVSYTYSHATDTVSNGGISPFSNNDSSLVQFLPNSQALNYGNADYDVRHAVNMNYVYQVPFTFGNKFVNFLAGGWTVAGTLFYHSGYPFTVFDSTAAQGLLRNATNTALPANITGPVNFNACSSGPSIDVNAPSCIPQTGVFSTVGDPIDVNGGQIPTLAAGLTGNGSNQRRNQFRGPGYFNTDMSLSKALRLTERFRLTLGANAYNVLNHPNFGNPTGSLAGGFGSFFTTVNPPTSALGSQLGGDAASRSIQLEAKMTF